MGKIIGFVVMPIFEEDVKGAGVPKEEAPKEKVHKLIKMTETGRAICRGRRHETVISLIEKAFDCNKPAAECLCAVMAILEEIDPIGLPQRFQDETRWKRLYHMSKDIFQQKLFDYE